jgi:hypothetical protein
MTTVKELIGEYKKSGKFDEMRKILLTKFSEGTKGQQLLNSLQRLANEADAPSKNALVSKIFFSQVDALAKSAYFNSVSTKEFLGSDLFYGEEFKENLKKGLKESLEEIQKKKEMANVKDISFQSNPKSDFNAAPSHDISIPLEPSAQAAPALVATPVVAPSENMIEVEMETVVNIPAPQVAELKVGSKVGAQLNGFWFLGTITEEESNNSFLVRIGETHHSVDRDNIVDMFSFSFARLMVGSKVMAIYQDSDDDSIQFPEFYKGTITRFHVVFR